MKALTGLAGLPKTVVDELKPVQFLLQYLSIQRTYEVIVKTLL